MDDKFIQLGVGGAVAVITLKVVLDFIKWFVSRRENRVGSNPGLQFEGGDFVTRGEFGKHKDVVQYRKECNQIVKRLEDANSHQKETQNERHEFVKQQFGAVQAQFMEVKQMLEGLKA